MLEGSKILIVEDENHIAEGLAFNLKKLGLIVEIASNGVIALEKWEDFAPDLIVLDIMLPKIDGHQVLKTIRSRNNQIPILILSAKGQPVDRVMGLSLGGDDYLTKPFELEEFILRIKKLLQRSYWQKNNQTEHQEEVQQYKFGFNIIDFRTHEAINMQGKIILTDQEMKLFKVFMHNEGKIMNRDELLTKAWGYHSKVESRTIDNFIVRFRKYFEVDPKKPEHFKNLRGKGYIFISGNNKS